LIYRAADLAVLRWGYKRSRELARRMRYYRGEFVAKHPTFGEDSQASCKQAMPVDVTAPDILYTEEDDKAIDAYSRNLSKFKTLTSQLIDLTWTVLVQTSWHSVWFWPFLGCSLFVNAITTDGNVCNETTG
jgi:hypothetical protein